MLSESSTFKEELRLPLNCRSVQMVFYTNVGLYKCLSVHLYIQPSVFTHTDTHFAMTTTRCYGGSAECDSTRGDVPTSLNIENEETHQLARGLVQQSVETRIGRLRAIRKRCARLLKAGGPSAVEHGDLLYDENGLPN